MKQAVIKLVAGTLASKLLGFLRETMFAAWFGTTEIAAAYRIAQSIVFTFINLLFGDAFGAGLLPLYQKERATSPEKGAAVMLAALGASLFLGLFLGGLAFAFAGPMIEIFAPGANLTAKNIAVSLIQIMSLAIPVIMLGDTIAYIEAAHDRYKALSSRASLTNIGIIATAAAAKYFDHTSILGIGYVAVYTAFMLWAFSDLKKHGHLALAIRPEAIQAMRPALRALWLNTYSLLGIPMAVQLTCMVERIIASWIDTSAIPALDYARFLGDTVVNLSAVPMGIAILARSDLLAIEDVRRDAIKYGRLLLTLFAPLSLWMFLSADDIVRIVYMRGAFDAHSAATTAAIFTGIALSLGPVVTGFFFQKVLNKSMENRYVLRAIVTGALCNITFDLSLWHVMGPAVLGYGGCINGIILFLMTTHKLRIWPDIAPVVLAILPAGLAAIALHTLLPSTPYRLVNIGMTGLILGFVWYVLYGLAPSIRQSLIPLFEQISAYRRRPS